MNAYPVENRAQVGIVTDKLSDQIYRLLRERIVRGQLRAASRIDLPALMAELGISKTPLREALARLELDHLVVTKPRSGTYVAELTVEDIREVCDLRKGFEWVATFEATSKMPAALLRELRAEIVDAEQQARDGNYDPFFASDLRLHRTIVQHSGNRRLIRAREALEAYVDWMRVVGATGVHRIAGSTRRHLEIVDAMLAGKAEQARDAAAIHVEEVKVWTIEDFAQLR
ncbi:GntR family transcriptional regulator [Saccharopolyspora phatthalungensis]|uniref:DNA-binding GntR family transcriptional regulator n=1 Tax=Saccharopolyspora phatthalungensis TaxID=664693 RepID=A0A840QBH6_9PSEU|nr:GntR family transcriptional regulator [Saccharopolyspora phatthalungensis]MBB5157766.1 DNA-binding GntR family transcriptional regulator [Saccharopolyspora phatthalungensis]